MDLEHYLHWLRWLHLHLEPTHTHQLIMNTVYTGCTWSPLTS
jgi:hypothetical protein